MVDYGTLFELDIWRELLHKGILHGQPPFYRDRDFLEGIEAKYAATKLSRHIAAIGNFTENAGEVFEK